MGGRFLAAAFVLATIVPAAPAWAHADYRDSDPSDGASVSSPPEAIWAEFTEEPSEGSTLVVTDPCGRRVDHGDYSYDPFPINRIHVSMSGSATGQYSVTWTVISAADGHTTRGTYTFTSTGGQPCAEEEDEEGSSGGRAERPSAGGGNGDAEIEAAGDDPAADVVGSDDGRDKERVGKRNEGRGESRRERAVLLAQNEERGDEGRAEREEEEIPLDWLVVGFLLSALIGAAGGRVYANILGPRGDPR